MGNKPAKLDPEATEKKNRRWKKITEHPLTTAVLEKNRSVPVLADLMTEHVDSIENVKVSFPNEEERYVILSSFFFSNQIVICLLRFMT